MNAKKFTLAALSALMLAGCGGNKSVSYDPSTYKEYVVMGSDFTTLNYLYSWAQVDFQVAINFVTGLVENDPYGQIVPSLAESWEHNEDNTVWTFHLRDNAKWYTRDGEEYADVTADDFVYGVEYILDPANQSYNVEMVCLLDGAEEYLAKKDAGEPADMATVGVKALDEHTVQYTMKQGAPYFISACLYTSFFPANRQFIEAIEDTDESVGTALYGSTPDLLLYNGPFIMGEYTPDNYKTYIKNENYWDADNVHFDKVEVMAVKDTETVKEYFERGETSHCPLTTTQVQALVNKDQTENLVQLPTEASVRQIMLNCLCSYSDDVSKAVLNENFRKAIYHATDQDKFNELSVALNVEAIRGYGWTASDFMYTPEGVDYTQLGGLAKYQGVYCYDQAKAEQYRDVARAELEKEGVTFPITLKYYYKSGNEVAANQAFVLQDIYEGNLGEDFVKIELNEYATAAEWTGIRKSGDYGIATGAWGPDYADPINMLTPCMTTGNFNNVDINFGTAHYNYPEFDEMIKKANAETTDITKRYTMFAEAEAYLYDHAYLTPLYTYGGAYEMTTINNFTKPYYKSGVCYMSLKYIQGYDHVISAEENEQFKAEWEAKRKELGIGA